MGSAVLRYGGSAATLKVYKEKNGEVTLEPRNKMYDVIKPKELEIRGKFIGLIRK